MHIADGILTPPVVAATVVLAAAGVAAGVRKVDADRVPRVGVLAALFFVASLIHVPLGVSSAHLLLNGLLGLLLGWAVFPALAVALLLQTIVFHFGGLVSLGANVLNMGIPALVCYGLFGRRLRRVPSAPVAFALGAAGGAVGVMGAGVMMSACLLLSGRGFLAAAGAVLVAHVPVMIVEAVVTGFAVSFVARVRPGLLVGNGGRYEPGE